MVWYTHLRNFFLTSTCTSCCGCVFGFIQKWNIIFFTAIFGLGSWWPRGIVKGWSPGSCGHGIFRWEPLGERSLWEISKEYLPFCWIRGALSRLIKNAAGEINVNCFSWRWRCHLGTSVKKVLCWCSNFVEDLGGNIRGSRDRYTLYSSVLAILSQ